jgi:hypothetical protein
VEFDQRADERGEADQLVAGAGAQAHLGAASGGQSGESDAFAPIQVVEKGLRDPVDGLQPDQRITGHGQLDHVEGGWPRRSHCD